MENTMDKWDWVCWTGLSSLEERNRSEELPDELWWVHLSCTLVASPRAGCWYPTRVGSWSSSSPHSSVFSASISHSSKCESGSEAKLKDERVDNFIRLADKPSLRESQSALQFSTSQNSHRVKKKDFALTPSSVWPHLPRDGCNNSYSHQEPYHILRSPLHRDTQARQVWKIQKQTKIRPEKQNQLHPDPKAYVISSR